ncbi:MAG: hypothetical protein KC609_22770, partial [Myxococcales bacterium]|nr:hypothetical protein [Myxococcales bacterium]
MISYPQLFPGLGLALVLLLGVACHDLPQCSNGATNPPTCTPPSSDTSNRDGYGPTDVSSASDLDDTLSPSDTLGDLISTADGDEPRDASNDGGSDQPADAGFDGTFQDDLSKPSSCNPWAALCSDPGSLVTKVLTYDEVKTRLIRKWLLCSPVSVFSTSDEAGFELKGDGTYAKLLVSSDGQLVAGTGFENEGTWELLDTT